MHRLPHSLSMCTALALLFAQCTIPATARETIAPSVAAPRPSAGAASFTPGDPRYYDIGTPTLTDIWVDPDNGNDANTGAARQTALRTVTAAWNRIPMNVTLTTTGYRVMLARGIYPESALPNYLEARYGAFQFPIIFQAADGRGTAILQGDLSIFDSRYFYLIDINIEPSPPGDTLHCELCDHFLMRGVRMNGGVFVPGGANQQLAHDNLKINQSQYVYLEDSNVSGAGDNAVDFVAVQYGAIVGNRIHNANDWCAYIKGGSAYFRIEANEIYDCGTGGFTAGQGTGFQFMVSPWLHYETYDVKIVNNIIHDTEGAGLGVNGGYNILLAYNTLYRIGSRSHAVEFVHGRRGCDGGRADLCQPLLDIGGWGLTTEEQQFIPNRNVFFYNNIIYNPTGFQSPQHFEIRGSLTPPTGSNAPNPSIADQNVQVRGNMIWNGPADLPLGIEDPAAGCQDANPTCNATQLRADNAINTVQPQLINPAACDFRPAQAGSVFSATTFDIPAFGWSDAPITPPVPQGTLSNAVARDYTGAIRSASGPPGAYSSATAGGPFCIFTYVPLLSRG